MSRPRQPEGIRRHIHGPLQPMDRPRPAWTTPAQYAAAAFLVALWAAAALIAWSLWHG